jgi:hypothetical protein
MMPAVAPGADRKIQRIVLPGQTPEGQHILSVLVKRTYDILPGRSCVRAEADRKLISGDQHWEDPMNSSVKFESDFVPFKPATDVALDGKVYVADGGTAYRLQASLEVGEFRKDLLVTGERICRYRPGSDPVFTEPRTFSEMELRYERAYGGADIYSDLKLPCLYPRNPHGRGFAILNKAETVEGLELPNLEDPGDPLTPERVCCGHFMHWERQPMPQSFGWFPKAWQPRSSLAGVLPADRAIEQEMRKAYAQLVPAEQRDLYAQTELPDMDFRFFNGASQGLALPFLNGDEKVRAANLTPEGDISFQLPGERPKMGIDIGQGLNEPSVVLHTVMIRMEERQVDLVWRAAAPYPGPDWLPQMWKMEVLVE